MDSGPAKVETVLTVFFSSDLAEGCLSEPGWLPYQISKPLKRLDKTSAAVVTGLKPGVNEKLMNLDAKLPTLLQTLFPFARTLLHNSLAASVQFGN